MWAEPGKLVVVEQDRIALLFVEIDSAPVIEVVQITAGGHPAGRFAYLAHIVLDK